MAVDAPATTSSKKGTDLVALEAELGVHLQAAAEVRAGLPPSRRLNP